MNWCRECPRELSLSAHGVLDLGSNLEENLKRWSHVLKRLGDKYAVWKSSLVGKDLARVSGPRFPHRAGGLMTNEQPNQILKELEMLRKLKIIELFDKAYSQAQLAQALGVSQPTISRMMPKVSTKKG